MLVSDCCGHPVVGNSDDYGICLECGEFCEYVDDEEESEDYTEIWQENDLKRFKANEHLKHEAIADNCAEDEWHIRRNNVSDDHR